MYRAVIIGRPFGIRVIQALLGGSWILITPILRLLIGLGGLKGLICTVKIAVYKYPEPPSTSYKP